MPSLELFNPSLTFSLAFPDFAASSFSSSSILLLNLSMLFSEFFLFSILTTSLVADFILLSGTVL